MVAVGYLVRSLFICSCVLTCLSGCKAWTTARTCTRATSSSGILRRNRLSISHRGPIVASRCQSPTNPLATSVRTHQQHISPSTAARSRVSLSLGIIDVEESASQLVPILLIVAVSLFVASQGWINSLLSGDRGLGAFLSDGSGYSKSGFRPVSKSGDGKESAESGDPLPWLKLPRFDFVDVAGQDSSVTEEAVLKRLEELRVEMNDLLEQEKFREAGAVRLTLEKLMKVNGVDFQNSLSSDKNAK
jgi:hypothetical protein